MIKRMLLLAAAIVFVTAAPALAGGDQYTPNDAVAGVSDDGSITVTGENCPPGGAVDYSVADSSGATVDSGSTTAESDGSYAFTTEPLPDGEYQVSVTCGGETQVLGVSVTVGATGTGGTATGEQAQAQGALPDTGTDTSIPLARLGVILVASGGVAVYAAKKRQGRRAAFIDA